MGGGLPPPNNAFPYFVLFRKSVSFGGGGVISWGLGWAGLVDFFFCTGRKGRGGEWSRRGGGSSLPYKYKPQTGLLIRFFLLDTLRFNHKGVNLRVDSSQCLPPFCSGVLLLTPEWCGHYSGDVVMLILPQKERLRLFILALSKFGPSPLRPGTANLEGAKMAVERW